YITANSLEVSRVSIWLYTDNPETGEQIECISAYRRNENKFYRQELLTRSDNSRYFEAIKRETVIIASDARHHPDTQAFSEKYLSIHDISSMMDAPFFIDGKLAGVICCEHQYEMKVWTPE